MVLALAASMVFSGCETPAPANQTQVAPKDMTINQDLLRAGERIRIIYLDIPDAPTPTEQQIPESGKLTLPKGVEVMFANKLKTDVEKEIQDIYVNQRRLYPRMTVNIERQGLTVSIGGEVRTPGSVLHSGQMTVTRAINAAGGFTEFALHSDVVITRAISGQQIHVNVDKALKKPALDVPVYPGDSVLVRRRIL
jgi:polysaccharide export outer membrane protein